MFRSLHMKLMLIMTLLIISLMTVVGAFLINSVANYYTQDFYTQMSEPLATRTSGRIWRRVHNLKTDYVDIYQFHNPAVCPKPGDGSGLYEAMLEAKEQGKIRFIGITNHRMSIAEEAIESGLYDTLQFPFNYLSTEREIALAKACAEHEMGFIAMKGLSGGLLTNSAAIYAYMHSLRMYCRSGVYRRKASWTNFKLHRQSTGN